MNELTVNLENLTKQEREQLTSLLEKSQKPKRQGTWFPKEGEMYWFVAANGPMKCSNNNDHSDCLIFTVQDPCKTKEEAIRVFEQRKAIVKVNRQVREIIATEYPEWVCDWNDDTQEKHYPVYRYVVEDVFYMPNTWCQQNFLFEHAPKGVWERIDKDLIKLAMGVKTC